MSETETEIEVVLEGPNGPKVVVTGEVEPEQVLAALPKGWTVHDDDWNNGVKLFGGSWSYPLSRLPGRPVTGRGRNSPQVVVRMTPDQHSMLEQDAEAQGVTPAEALRRAYFGE